MSSSIELSIVIPVYNGASSIERLVAKVLEHLSNQISLEIILINDGSVDSSWEKLQTLHQQNPTIVTVLNLTKNFGEHNAVMAGYHHCQGKYIVNIDDDFQNPPSEILKLYQEIHERYDVVYSAYETKKHSVARNLGSWFNDKVANIMLRKPKGLYLSSFRIITHQLCQQLLKYEGPYPYIDGLILRATAKIGTIIVTHSSREEGTSNYTLIKLLRLWSHVFFNFSLLPLRIASFLGIIFSLTGFLGALFFILEKLMNPSIQVGWASLIVSILLLSGVQLLMLGLVGEYVGRIYMEQTHTPQFVIGHLYSSQTAKKS